MHWQDFIYAGGTVILGLALIPAIRSRLEKPPLATLVPSATALIAMAVAAFTLGLWLTTGMMVAEVVGYGVLIYQKVGNSDSVLAQ